MTQPVLKAPFPWYGGKARAAHLVWPRFGETVNYVEPFCGSCAVLLNRPHEAKNETVNDKDCFLANFWRALKADPEGVCEHCDWPVNEADLHSRHAWLLSQGEFRERMLTDPDYFDVKIAGWWVWGLCCWIGGEWCSESVITKTGRTKRLPPHNGTRGVNRKRPLAVKGGVGVQAKRPRIAAGGRGVTKTWQARPRIQGGGQGITSANLDLLAYLTALSDRLRRVVVCCGDWSRVLTPVVTTTIGLTAVLLDPPYGTDAGRDPTIYAEEDLAVAAKVRDWAVAHGDDPKLRIALCGYEGEHSMPDSWECVTWKAHPINNKAQKNHKRERIWFSPHCLHPQEGLFADFGLRTSDATNTDEEVRHAAAGVKTRDGRGLAASPVRRAEARE